MQWVAVCAGPSLQHFFPIKFTKITEEIFPELLNHHQRIKIYVWNRKWLWLFCLKGRFWVLFNWDVLKYVKDWLSIDKITCLFECVLVCECDWGRTGGGWGVGVGGVGCWLGGVKVSDMYTLVANLCEYCL